MVKYLLPLGDISLRAPAIGDIAKHKDNANHPAITVTNGRSAVVDRDLISALRQKDCVIRQTSHNAFPQHFGYRAFNRCPGCSLTMRKMSSGGLPTASSWSQPVSA